MPIKYFSKCTELVVKVGAGMREGRGHILLILTLDWIGRILYLSKAITRDRGTYQHVPLSGHDDVALFE